MKTALKLAAAWLLLSTLNPQLSTAFAQNNIVTYQGRVTANGTNFTGTGQFKFALVTSSNTSAQATATANRIGSSVTSYNLVNGGAGYGVAPAVTISGGGGSGATATTVVSGGAVIAILPGSFGFGYTSTPTVTIAPPPPNLIYTTYWSNDGTSSAGSEPATTVGVAVANGLFTARLGDPALANMAALGAGLFTRPDLQLRLWFNDGVTGFALLNPAQPLTAAPYALAAGSASILLGTVNTANVGGTYGNAVMFTNAANSFSGSGTGLNNVNATLLDGLDSTAFWRTSGNAGTTAGTHFLGTTDNQPLELKVNGLRALRLEDNGDSASDAGTTPDGAPSLIAGSPHNFVGVGVVGATIAGGGTTNYNGSAYTNSVLSDFGVVGGGLQNTIAADAPSVTIPGGVLNSVGPGAAYAFAAGRRAKASHPGTFVWADSQDADFASTATNQFRLRAAGGVLLDDTTSLAFGTTTRQMLHLWRTDYGIGVQNLTHYFRTGLDGGFSWYSGGIHSNFSYSPGTGGTELMRLTSSSLRVNGTFVSSSDRNVKADFAAVNAQEVLEKVAALPLQSWSYTNQPGVKHVGPMAQDFRAAFGLGEDDKHIATVDADGVALAAIQGLNQKLEEKEARVTALEMELAELKQLVVKLSSKGN